MSVEVKVANGKYRLSRKIGGGSFGEVFKAVDVDTKEVVAVKLEARRAKVPQLVFEARLIKYLQHGTLSVGIPAIRWYGSEGDYNVMVMDMLGPSLEKLFAFCGKKFSSKTVAMLALQILCRLEFVHAKSYIHRDIKPDNFLMGTGKRGHHVYIVDFGLSKKYRDPRTLQHIPFKEGKSLTGTARFVSVYTHLGMEQSRRDDLESAAYMLLYFARGNLPWQGFKAVDKQEKYEKIAEKKMSLSPEALCRFLPAPLFEFLLYVKQLDFQTAPDYNKCREFFSSFLNSEQMVHDYQFDWCASARSAETRTVESTASQGVNSSRNAIMSSRSGGGSSAPGNQDFTGLYV